MLVSAPDAFSVTNKEVSDNSPNQVGFNSRTAKPRSLYREHDSGSLADSFRGQLEQKSRGGQSSSPNKSIFDNYTASEHMNVYEPAAHFASTTSGPWSQPSLMASAPVSHQDWHSRLFDSDPVFNRYEAPNQLERNPYASSGAEVGMNRKPVRRSNSMKWNESLHNAVISRAASNNSPKYHQAFDSDIYASTFRLLNEESNGNAEFLPHPSQFSEYNHSSQRTPNQSDQFMSSNWSWSTPVPKPQPPVVPMTPNRHVSAGYGSVEPNEKIVPSRNQIDVWKIANGYDNRTTFMIRNIPNRYTQKMLLECLDETQKGEYDFVYLRMDFKNHCNVGYAFINFINVNAVLSFIETRVGRKWSKFNSDKICHLSYANIQGKMALIEKFRNSSVMEKDPSYRPKIFHSSGPLRGVEEPFPMPGKHLTPQADKNFEEAYSLSSRVFPQQVDFNMLNPAVAIQHPQLFCTKPPSKEDWKVDWQEFDSDTDSGISNSLEDSLDSSFGNLSISGLTGTNAAGHFVCKN
ncbi:hypothetical protein K7432_009398 [Basidiobolus ranarum]|uniref:RRM domain-containing protein n=1 Tax=Basidiobolus ranarum TaxID=34480 RepID=A0ABR2VXJ7_9FUNG